MTWKHGCSESEKNSLNISSGHGFSAIMSMVVVGHSTERHYLSAVFADRHSLHDSALPADPTLEGCLLMVPSPGKSAKAEGENLRLASASPSA